MAFSQVVCFSLSWELMRGIYRPPPPPHIKKHQQLSKTDLKNVWKVFPAGKGTDTAAVVAAIWQQTAM